MTEDTETEIRVCSFNGVTSGPYRTEAKAQKVAGRLNEQDPNGRWHVARILVSGCVPRDLFR